MISRLRTLGAQWILPVFFSVLAASFLSTAAFAQTDHAEVLATIDTFFEGFNSADADKMLSVLDPGARVVITMDDQDGAPVMRPIPINAFIEMIAQPREETFRETYWSPEVRVEENLAAVWLEYNFWVGDEIDHCGNDHLQLFRSSEGWKIIAIADTQVRAGCEPR